MALQKGASLAPEDHAGAGQVPDGDYTIIECYTGLNTYNGNVPDGVPAIVVVYKSDDGQLYEQYYKAGDNDHLAPSDDSERFIHPSGGEARIYKGGAASLWLGSIVKAGMKITGDSVKQFKGTRVTLESVAAPKGRGTDAKEGKVIPLVSKILGTVKTSPKAMGSTAPKPTQQTFAADTPASVPNVPGAANGNGDLGETTRSMILEILSGAPNNTITRVKLGTSVMLAAAKNPDLKGNMMELKKMSGDASWLVENAEIGGWKTDGETVQL